MKEMIIFELKRSFRTKGFILAICVGMIIVVLQFVIEVYPYSKILQNYLQMNIPMKYPGWLFSVWIGGNQGSIFPYIYFFIIPLLAAMPFATSFFKDAKSGFIQNICTRVDKKIYFFSKYIATFVSGGTVVILPLLINFLLSCMVLPSMKPELSSFTTLIGQKSLTPGLYFNYPFIYVLLL